MSEDHERTLYKKQTLDRILRILFWRRGHEERRIRIRFARFYERTKGAEINYRAEKRLSQPKEGGGGKKRERRNQRQKKRSSRNRRSVWPSSKLAPNNEWARKIIDVVTCVYKTGTKENFLLEEKKKRRKILVRKKRSTRWNTDPRGVEKNSSSSGFERKI